MLQQITDLKDMALFMLHIQDGIMRKKNLSVKCAMYRKHVVLKECRTAYILFTYIQIKCISLFFSLLLLQNYCIFFSNSGWMLVIEISTLHGVVETIYCHHSSQQTQANLRRPGNFSYCTQSSSLG